MGLQYLCDHKVYVWGDSVVDSRKDRQSISDHGSEVVTALASEECGIRPVFD